MEKNKKSGSQKKILSVSARIKGQWKRKSETVYHEMSKEECKLAMEILQSVDLMRLTGMLSMSKRVEYKKKRIQKPAYSIQFCKRCKAMRYDMKALRKKCKMTQGQFAKMLGVSIPTLCRYEAKAETDPHTAYLASQIESKSEMHIEACKRNTRPLPGRLLVAILRGE